MNTKNVGSKSYSLIYSDINLEADLYKNISATYKSKQNYICVCMYVFKLLICLLISYIIFYLFCSSLAKIAQIINKPHKNIYEHVHMYINNYIIYIYTLYICRYLSSHFSFSQPLSQSC